MMEDSEIIIKIDTAIEVITRRIKTADDKDLEGLCKGLKSLIEARIYMET